MELPNRTYAYIPQQKLIGYLLSETHSVGKSKAKFFHTLGFSQTELDFLEQQLLQVAHTTAVTDVMASPYGTKYVLDGVITTPIETSARIRTVWIIETGEEYPRFVTAYPL